LQQVVSLSTTFIHTEDRESWEEAIIKASKFISHQADVKQYKLAYSDNGIEYR